MSVFDGWCPKPHTRNNYGVFTDVFMSCTCCESIITKSTGSGQVCHGPLAHWHCTLSWYYNLASLDEWGIHSISIRQYIHQLTKWFRSIDVCIHSPKLDDLFCQRERERESREGGNLTFFFHWLNNFDKIHAKVNVARIRSILLHFKVVLKPDLFKTCMYLSLSMFPIL